jgi:mRNA interferase MazF
VVVNVPFTNHSGAKRRPALVVSAAAFHRKLPDIIICPISSQPRYFGRSRAGDRPLQDWKTAGLRRPSTVRVSKILAVEKNLIARRLGKASAQDLRGVEESLRLALNL